ncbi:MAG TPA: hypothetical protein VLF40_03585 [Candidatus Saccharimonadales bacterium]|nr:hypothetical protein [Candidatus Saccharimonadales bacterium]
MNITGTGHGMVVGSGKPKRGGRQGFFMNAWGMLVAVALIFGGIGAYALYTSFADSLDYVAYSGPDADGCGGNASHYARDKQTHVNYVNYGANSVCRCHSSTAVWYIAYNGYMSNAQQNPCTLNDAATVVYTSHNDGCGGNATHYDVSKTVHVGQSNYGDGSLCVCNNGVTFAYGTTAVYSDAYNNPNCTSASATPVPVGVTEYLQHNDGCGGYATHYNDYADSDAIPSNYSKKTIHVGPSNDGNHSVCKCDTSVGGAYSLYSGTAILDTTRNPNCGGTPSSSSTSSGSTTSGSTTSTTTGTKIPGCTPGGVLTNGYIDSSCVPHCNSGYALSQSSTGVSCNFKTDDSSAASAAATKANSRGTTTTTSTTGQSLSQLASALAGIPTICAEQPFSDGSGYKGTDCKNHCYVSTMVLHVSGSDAWCSPSPIVNLRNTTGITSNTSCINWGGRLDPSRPAFQMCVKYDSNGQQQLAACIESTITIADCWLVP